jgi:predicted nucleotidyltransferase
MEIAQQTFRQFEEDLRLVLKENLFEIIIHGSYLLGDFRPNLGDLDFMVLTNDSLDKKTSSNLLSLHENYRTEKPLLLYQLEGTYCPKSFMKNPEERFVGFYVGTSRMKSITDRQNSYMDLKIINQQGLMLLGSNCDAYKPDKTELLAEQKSDCLAFRNTVSQDSSVDFGFWISLIHWSARTLFYRAKGLVGSKTEACRWCSEQSNLGEFQKLFNYAKSLRFPYIENQIQSKTKISCIELLDFVDIWSNN